MKHEFLHNRPGLLRCWIRCSMPFLLSMLFTPVAFAYDLNPSDLRNTAPTNSTSVLQSRFFLKALRPEIGPGRYALTFATVFLLSNAIIEFQNEMH